MEYKMKLTDEQKAVLEGSRGEVMAKVMETVVMFGDIFGAEKLVPVTHKDGHLVTSFGIAPVSYTHLTLPTNSRV